MDANSIIKSLKQALIHEIMRSKHNRYTEEELSQMNDDELQQALENVIMVSRNVRKV